MNRQGPTCRHPVRSSSADIVRLVDELRAGGVDVHLRNRCGEELDRTMGRPVGAAAYRIVQEALTNAVKHAGAARIDVELVGADGELAISVVDDGLGAAAVANPSGGRGIAGMTERAVVLGGRLAAGPREGGGFRVEARLPSPMSEVSRPPRPRPKAVR